MLKIPIASGSGLLRRRPRCRVYPGQRVSRKYRRAVVRRVEYRRLQKLIPDIARRRKVPELTVILEAVKYIDKLHSAIADRVRTIRGLQSVGGDRKGSTECRAITNDTMQQVVFLSNRTYHQTADGATRFRRFYPYSSSATMPASSTAAMHQNPSGRRHTKNTRTVDSITSRAQGMSNAEKLRMPASAAAAANSRDCSSCQKLTMQRHLAVDSFLLATNNALQRKR